MYGNTARCRGLTRLFDYFQIYDGKENNEAKEKRGDERNKEDNVTDNALLRLEP